MTAGAIGANTLGVLAGCMLFGALAGAVGTFVLARRRALVADVAGHAALPGVALAFLAGEALGLGGRTPWLLLLGGATTALLAAWCVPALSRLRRIGPDGATAVVLAGFFGLGAVLFSIVQGHPAGSQGGLRTLLFGSAAAMGRAEVVALLALATVTLALLIVFLRGLTVVAFDEDFARSAGLPVRGLDLLLTVLLVATVVAGMQMAGIVLVVAMVITPAAAARNLGGRIGSVTAIAAILGAVTAAAGVIASRAVAGVPTGAAMTLAATAAFLVTVPFGRLARGSRA
ncbi:MAG: metal ABC transporter permease [Planctomycetota bacterium]|jgi:manganese/zinc/iron transport system permease protein|nr:metal ABC transporter permease [Planctomycetota bacterium]